MSHIALFHRANTIAPMLRRFRVSSMTSLLTPINLRVLISVVNRETVLVFTVSRRDGTDSSSFPETNFSTCTLVLLGLSPVHTEGISAVSDNSWS